ncbi:hypothetical protein C8R46DRAFT_1031 [Mycena filopes]|nr:hypothetical protein C8R46DRAFT_1031 [Mycena filopes]
MSLLEADRRCIAELDAQISELEAALRDYAAALSGLRGRKAIAQERIDSYKYPVLTLPPEIVSEIFTHFLPTYPDCPPLIGPLSPTRLTQICRAWREISLGTLSLWRAIALSAEGDFPPARLARELDIWVSRSGRCPIMAIDFKFLPDPRVSSELLASIAAQRARLEHMSLELDDAVSLLPFSGPMPRLRHLDLDFNTPCIAESGFELSASEAPLLRTVFLTFNPATVDLPWTQLTSLTLRYVYPHECSPVLEETTNLTFCHLLLVFNEDDFDTSPDVTLRSLTSFKLEAASASDSIPEYLHTFAVPSLRSLEITEGFLGHDPLQSLALFMSKAGCNLQEVIMHNKHGISRTSYRAAFPLINVSFIADGEATGGSEA